MTRPLRGFISMKFYVIKSTEIDLYGTVHAKVEQEYKLVAEAIWKWSAKCSISKVERLCNGMSKTSIFNGNCDLVNQIVMILPFEKVYWKACG